MRLIEPDVELLEQGNSIDDYNHHVATCARICYASDKGNDEVLINNLITRKHFSMFRHATRYYKIPYRKLDTGIIDRIRNVVYINSVYFGSYLYLAINGNFALDHNYLMNIIDEFEISSIEAENIEIVYNNIFRYTFIVTTQISTSRELNRVSPNNIAEQSTRYCNFNKGKFNKEITICKPWWYDESNEQTKLVANANWENAENAYFDALNMNLNPQGAREFLPLATATKCAYTYSIKEWCHILALRYYGITGAPHPNAKIIASMIKDKLNQIYNVKVLMKNFGYNID